MIDKTVLDKVLEATLKVLEVIDEDVANEAQPIDNLFDMFKVQEQLPGFNYSQDHVVFGLKIGLVLSGYYPEDADDLIKSAIAESTIRVFNSITLTK